MRPLETIMNRGCQRVGPSKPYDAGDPGFRYRKEIDGDPNRNENCTRQNFSNNGFLGPPCCLVPTGYVIRAINLVRRCEFGGKLLQQLVIQRPNAHSTIQVMIGRRKGDFMSGPLTTRGYIIAIVLYAVMGKKPTTTPIILCGPRRGRWGKPQPYRRGMIVWVDVAIIDPEPEV